MDIERVRDFANQNPVCWFATSDGDQPHVRGMLMWYADDTGFYFHTGSVKQLYTHLINNNKIEVAFHHQGSGPGDSVMMRITGKVEFVNDESFKERLVEQRPFVKDIEQDRPDLELVIFKISTGEAHFWDITVNTREKEQKRIKF